MIEMVMFVQSVFGTVPAPYDVKSTDFHGSTLLALCEWITCCCSATTHMLWQCLKVSAISISNLKCKKYIKSDIHDL